MCVSVSLYVCISLRVSAFWCVVPLCDSLRYMCLSDACRCHVRETSTATESCRGTSPVCCFTFVCTRACVCVYVRSHPRICVRVCSNRPPQLSLMERFSPVTLLPPSSPLLSSSRSPFNQHAATTSTAGKDVKPLRSAGAAVVSFASFANTSIPSEPPSYRRGSEDGPHGPSAAGKRFSGMSAFSWPQQEPPWQETPEQAFHAFQQQLLSKKLENDALQVRDQPCSVVPWSSLV